MGRYLDLAKMTPLPGREIPPRKMLDPALGGAPPPETPSLLESVPTTWGTTKTTETTKAPPPSPLEPDDPELAWRVEAMRKQIPPSGAIPDLVAREAPVRSGTCFSCGDPLTANQHYRCRPCAVAAAVAIWGVCPQVVAEELARRESS